jgi:hypothetical protein
MKVPKVIIRSANANVKSAELHGAVTVGPESAKLLSKKLGREVKPGEVIDLGVIAYYNENPLKRLWGTLKVMSRHAKSPFNKPLK